MEATGIVAEYNPFHNGHLHHLQETKRRLGQPIIVVMSGSLMQRGEPAFGNKWLRSQLAVDQGASLVVELPAVFSLRSAEFFALGAVHILRATGCVNSLSCGVEHPETNFRELAELSYSTEFCQTLQGLLKQGLPYAAAQEQALQLLGREGGLRTPNDILALEYTKALLDTPIQPLYILREANNYNDIQISGSLASATAIRQAHLQGRRKEVAQALPASVFQSLEQEAWGYNEALLWQLIKYRLLLLSPAEIANHCLCSEGLEYLLKQAEDCSSLQEALDVCSKKRYPRARIRRLLLQLLLQKPIHYFRQLRPAYIRVLAFDREGRQLLKQMKATSTLPLLTKLGRNPSQNQNQSFQEQLELDLAATDLLNLLQGNSLRPHSDFFKAPYYNSKE